MKDIIIELEGAELVKAHRSPDLLEVGGFRVFREGKYVDVGQFKRLTPAKPAPAPKQKRKKGADK